MGLWVWIKQSFAGLKQHSRLTQGQHFASSPWTCLLTRAHTHISLQLYEDSPADLPPLFPSSGRWGIYFCRDVLLLAHPKRLYPSFTAGRRDWEASPSPWPHLASSKFSHSFCHHLLGLPPSPDICCPKVLFCSSHFWSAFSAHTAYSSYCCCLTHCFSFQHKLILYIHWTASSIRPLISHTFPLLCV